MDENLISLLEELSLRTSSSEDDYNLTRPDIRNRHMSSGYASQTSNLSSPSYDQLESGLVEEDSDLRNAVTSLFHELETTKTPSDSGYDKTKLLVALLGNIDLVKCAIKNINHLVSIGKRMEQLYRMYYVDPTVALDLVEVGNLIKSFCDLYNSENYVREVNVLRVYQAYCNKLMDIYNNRLRESS